MKYFIGDTHFQHVNILEFEKEKRPFKNIEEHDLTLIANWNRVVKPEDIVYHLGDVFFGDPRTVEPKLNCLIGHKYLILGNHDKPAHMRLYERHFEKIYGAAYFHTKTGLRGILTHLPVHEKQLDGRFLFNIHGHLHSSTIGDKRYLNVSCEHINLTPISEEEIFRI